MLAGVALSMSEGDGRFDDSGATMAAAGSVESAMTTVTPDARFNLTERISAWGLGSSGTGDMTIASDDGTETVSCDLSMRLNAVGAQGALLDPGEHGRGLSFSLKPTLDATSSVSERLWGARDARALASDDDALDAARGLRAEAGYGMSLFGDRFTGTPNFGFGLAHGGTRGYRVDWPLTSAVPGDPGFWVNLDVMRREVSNDDAEHGVMLRRVVRW